MGRFEISGMEEIFLAISVINGDDGGWNSCLFQGDGGFYVICGLGGRSVRTLSDEHVLGSCEEISAPGNHLLIGFSSLLKAHDC